MDLSLVINLVPEPWRTYILAALFAVVAAQMAASLIVALLPASAFVHPVVGPYARGLARFGHFKPSDAPGTLKPPMQALDARALDELARVAAQGQRVVDVVRPPPSNNQSGAVRVGALLTLCVVVLVLSALGAVLTGCPNWNRPACPRAGVYSCVSDQPHVCSPTGELTPIGDEACGLQGRVCSVDDAGVAYCARAADGGVR